MKLQLNKIALFFLVITSLYGKNMNYAENNIHTLTIPKGNINISVSYMGINDTIDILGLKKSQFNTASSFDSLGDMNGYKLGIIYGLSDDLMLSYEISRQTFAYNNNDLENTKNEIFARYNLFQYPHAVFNSGVSIDVGFINNKLNNFYITSIDDINKLSNRYFSNDNIKIVPNGNGLSLKHSNENTELKYYPWVGLEETSDNSFYLRVITGIYTSSSIYDFYIGAKRTKINNTVTANSELLEIANTNSYSLYKDLQRTETMFFAGTTVSYEMKDYILEFLYEYEHFQRESKLNYINSNHIVDLTIDYKIMPKMLLFMGAKMMYRQLNGQIPYLYNEYSQTTYDHLYGYAKFGITYNFK